LVFTEFKDIMTYSGQSARDPIGAACFVHNAGFCRREGSFAENV